MKCSRANLLEFPAIVAIQDNTHEISLSFRFNSVAAIMYLQCTSVISTSWLDWQGERSSILINVIENRRPKPFKFHPVMSAVAGLWKAANVKSTCFCFGPAFVFSSQPYCPLTSLSGQHLVWLTCVSEALTQFSAWRRERKERVSEWKDRTPPRQFTVDMLVRSVGPN